MASESEKCKEIIKLFLKNNLLISKEFTEIINEEFDEKKLTTILNSSSFNDLLVIDKNFEEYLQKNISINWMQMEAFKAQEEKGKGSKGMENFRNYIKNEIKNEKTDVISCKESFSTIQKEKINQKYISSVKIISSYDENIKKREVGDFVAYLNHRLNSISNLLRSRPEMSNAMSISRVLSKKERENVSIIGIVKEKEIRDNHVNIQLEDSTGEIKIIISKNNPELFEISKNLVDDEVLGITGLFTRGVIFANTIIWPDIPLTKELKKGPEETYAIFLSDIHVGSKKFLPEEFNRFIKWINAEVGSTAQREIAKKVGYIFIMGDLVDGVGIYPRQESELEIKEISAQYAECAKLLAQIPPHIAIIICAGNHDAVRISEPQPRLSKEYAGPLWKLTNVIMTTNPSMINIASTENFSGFDILIYHGYSFDNYVANVDSIRSSGGYDRADLIMKFLLQKRHLAPSHTSTLYIPDNKDDPLLIKKVPDIFATGHIHKSSVSTYRNVNLICGSCWQDKTAFQEKVGHHPEPARVPMVNLKTREIKVLSFNIPRQAADTSTPEAAKNMASQQQSQMPPIQTS